MDGRSSLTRDESRPLTGLRGLGALMVMAHHVFLHLDIHLHLPALEGLLWRAFMGVDLFFVLSGFVMSMVYGHWFDGSAHGGVRLVPLFLVRRVARLWPLHAAAVAVLIGLGLLGLETLPSPRQVVANLGLIQAWGVSAAINPPSWSVSVEFLAYLCFPLLAVPLLRWRSGLALGALCVAGLLAVCLHAAPALGLTRRGLLDIYYNYSLLPDLRCLAGFVMGMMAWRAGCNPRLQRWAALPWTGPLALALFLALLLARTDGLLAYVLLPPIVLGMHYGSGPVVRLFATGPLYRVGVLSYAVYLIHYVLLWSFPMGWGPLWTVLGAYVLVTVALASVAHWAIEVPGRRLLRRLGEGVLAMLPPLPVSASVLAAAERPLRRGPP